MAEKLTFYEVGTGKKYDDYFHLTLANGQSLWWKNFGQKIVVNNNGDKEDIRSVFDTKASGKFSVLSLKFLHLLQGIELYPWYVNSFELCYSKEEGSVFISCDGKDDITIIANKKWNSRTELTPEQDSYYWDGQWEHIDEYAKRTGQVINKALTGISNWRRPKLATNAPVKIVVMQNDEPKYVGILECEKKKTVIDASFRLLYTLRYIDWRTM